ncbi:MAG: GGDEF domain-containing protein [Proteobacteria bacterium]|nr:GGDEF domain-containing protein [Pseudomonadota bacterium]MBU1232770.1 GGDEF domain-containing protein [Pseudomonadota bacterium]MBU1419028.1 GGDEF domain-containing protein [Pseudomonadota bacterium]MBU1454108.1 GGDEF domain-containing protein [Pseudomonadota bacterium]
MALYAISFETIYPFVGDASAFNIIPAAVFGWFFKIRDGLLYGLISLPLNLVLFYSQGNSLSDQLMPTLVAGSAFALALAGMGVGWMKNLNNRTQRQSSELQEERKLLQKEIIKRTRAEERLTHEALHDPLTNLTNRRLLYNRIEHALAWSKRNPDNLSTLLYFDLTNLNLLMTPWGIRPVISY